MKFRRSALVVGLLLLALVVAACGGKKKEANSGADVEPVEIVIELGSADWEFMFNPDHLELKLNQPVRLIARNKGSHEHDLHIPEFNVNTPLVSPGQEYVLEFTPDKEGEFLMECRVAGHAAAGMTGTVKVVR